MLRGAFHQPLEGGAIGVDLVAVIDVSRVWAQHITAKRHVHTKHSLANRVCAGRCWVTKGARAALAPASNGPGAERRACSPPSKPLHLPPHHPLVPPPPPPISVPQILLDIAHSLQYIHRMGLLHSDIKLDNILLKSDPSRPSGVTPKLADFGLVGQLGWVEVWWG